VSDNGKTVGHLLLDEFIRLRELLQQQVDRQSHRTPLSAVSSRIAPDETLVDVPIAPNAVQACSGDSQRWLLAFATTNGTGGLVSIAAPDGATGLTVTQTQPVVLEYAKWGPLCQEAWNVISFGAPFELTVYTLRLLPPR
jgi:hypothetical protein